MIKTFEAFKRDSFEMPYKKDSFEMPKAAPKRSNGMQLQSVKRYEKNILKELYVVKNGMKDL